VSQLIQKIKDAADIVELISEHLPLKRSGASYVGLCPFHNDGKPSMHVSSSKGIFKCFSCGAGGDVLKFWSEYHKKDLKETIRDLANKYGIPIESSFENKEKDEFFNLAIKMHELAAKFYYDQLLASFDASYARQYLENRAVQTATISQFQLGFAPNDGTKLIEHLKGKLQVSEEAILEAGLAIKSDKNQKFYDRFRGRLMIPILDERSRVVGFGARQLDATNDQGPKYLNSPETSIYHKGSLLYAINFAKEEIRKQDSVIIVEGYFDAISLHQAGFHNVVANLGTALTAQQVKILAKFSDSKNIFLCYDTDTAGEKASDKAAEIVSQVLKHTNYHLKTIRVPGDKDPDDYIQQHGSESFRELVTEARYYIDYKIQNLLDNNTSKSPEAKAKVINDALPYLSQINNQIIISEYLKRISDALNIELMSLKNEVERMLRADREAPENPYQQRDRAKQQAIITQKPLAAVPSLFLEEEMLLINLLDRNILETFLREENSLISPECQEIMEVLVEVSFENPDLHEAEHKYSLLQEKLNGNIEVASILADLGMKLESSTNITDLNAKYLELSRRLKEKKLRAMISELKIEMQQITEGDHEWLEKLQIKVKLEQQVHQLKSDSLHMPVSL